MAVVALLFGSLLFGFEGLGPPGAAVRVVILTVVGLFAVWLSQERVRRELIAADSAARDLFVDLSEASADLIGMFSSDGSTKYLNPSGLALVGLESIEELHEIDALEFIPP